MINSVRLIQLIQCILMVEVVMVEVVEVEVVEVTRIQPRLHQGAS